MGYFPDVQNCPCCDSPCKWSEWYERVVCSVCYLRGPRVPGETKRQRIERWNTRHAPIAIVGPQPPAWPPSPKAGG